MPKHGTLYFSLALEIYLANNEKSDFVVQEMEIEVHGLNKEY